MAGILFFTCLLPYVTQFHGKQHKSADLARQCLLNLVGKTTCIDVDVCARRTGLRGWYSLFHLPSAASSHLCGKENKSADLAKP